MKISVVLRSKICQVDIFIMEFFEIFVSSLFLPPILLKRLYCVSDTHKQTARFQEEDYDINQIRLCSDCQPFTPHPPEGTPATPRWQRDALPWALGQNNGARSIISDSLS